MAELDHQHNHDTSHEKCYCQGPPATSFFDIAGAFFRSFFRASEESDGGRPFRLSHMFIPEGEYYDYDDDSDVPDDEAGCLLCFNGIEDCTCEEIQEETAGEKLPDDDLKGLNYNPSIIDAAKGLTEPDSDEWKNNAHYIQAKQAHAEFYTHGNNGKLKDAIEEYKLAKEEALRETTSGQYRWPKTLEDIDKLIIQISYNYGSALLELGMEEISRSQGEPTENTKKLFIESKSQLLDSHEQLKFKFPERYNNAPEFADLQAAYNFALATKELALISKDKGGKKKTQFERAVGLLRWAIPKCEGYATLRRDMLLIAGASFHLQYKISRELGNRRRAHLNSAATAYRAAYALDRRSASAATACYNLGNVLYEKTDFAHAVKYYEKAEELYNRLKDEGGGGAPAGMSPTFLEDLRFNLDIARTEEAAAAKAAGGGGGGGGKKTPSPRGGGGRSKSFSRASRRSTNRSS
mmetsp:Transcript_29430/g.46370  ORF Transcript_29430/g.46370 Transcript_29430/m.46370 type:complete len:465 (-) Transcript_29430:249-1643(-)